MRYLRLLSFQRTKLSFQRRLESTCAPRGVEPSLRCRPAVALAKVGGDKSWRGTRGFSIVESVLAVGVLAAGLTGLIFAIGSVKASSFLADQSTIALNIAQETMEKIIAQRDSNNAGGGYASTLTSIGAGTYNANPVSGFTGYVLTTTVSEKSPNSSGSTSDDFLTTSASSGYARVTVTVSYNGGTNSSVLETLICNY